MSSLIVLQVAAAALVLAFLISVRKSLRASDGPPKAAAAVAAVPLVEAPPVSPQTAPIPAPAAVEPAPLAYDRPRLVSSTEAPVAARPVALDEDLTAEEELALLERERDAALQQSAAAWKLLVQTRAERDRLREELDQARKALAAAEARPPAEAPPKRARAPRRSASQPQAEAKTAS